MVANKALIRMTEVAEHCGVATIADLFDIAGRSNTRPNIEYGWYPHDMNQAYIEEFNGRFILRLPEPKKIDSFA